MIHSKTTAFMFPGQGSQAIGMGKALGAEFPEAGAIFSLADKILGFPLSETMWNGPEAALNDTINTQPALFVHSMAAWNVYKSKFPNAFPGLMAGHSLGQLSAITAAGALSFEDGLLLVRKRGELMKQAGEVNPGGMAAIMGIDIPSLDRVCAEASTPDETVQVANDNCPGQVVISGHKPALERAMLGAKAAGAKRALPLAVSIAAHSPLMNSIQAEWEQAVNAAAFSDVNIPVVGNVSAKTITKAAELRTELIFQMQSRVRWTESIKWMTSQGINTFVEIGSGTVLGGLVKRIVEGVSSLPFGNPVDFDALK